MRRSAAETSVDYTAHWEQRGLCRGDPVAFDLDVIRNKDDAIRAALRACRACPVLAQCAAFTDGLPYSDRPRELIQAGRVWSSNGSLAYRFTGRCRHERDRAVESCVRCERDRIRRKEAVT